LTWRVLDQSAAVELAGGVFGGLLRNPVWPTRHWPPACARPHPRPPTWCRR